MTASSREDILKGVVVALRSAAASSEIVPTPAPGDDLFTAAAAPVIADWAKRMAAEKAAVAVAETLAAEELAQMLGGGE